MSGFAPQQAYEAVHEQQIDNAGIATSSQSH
jgi:hypothetical protein